MRGDGEVELRWARAERLSRFAAATSFASFLVTSVFPSAASASDLSIFLSSGRESCPLPSRSRPSYMVESSGRCFAPAGACTATGARALGEALRVNRTLHTLRLSGCA